MKILDRIFVRMYPVDGFLFGLEWDWHWRYCVINFGIFRIIVDFDVVSPQLKGL